MPADFWFSFSCSGPYQTGILSSAPTGMKRLCIVGFPDGMLSVDLIEAFSERCSFLGQFCGPNIVL